jgi:hypothetical protein
MARNGEKNLEAEVDALFKLSLSEFTNGRNALAARLKQMGRADDATLVKSLTKPSISAWAVNQLYWNYREEFDQLIATGQRFRQAQKSGNAGKVAHMRGSLDTRRESLTQLTDLAAELLQDAGHNPSPDTLRRITTTLEAVSAYASLSDGPTPGRLTQDVDPPGFEALASLMSGSGTMKTSEVTTRPAATQKLRGATRNTSSTAGATPGATRKAEETRQVRIAAAKLSLQDAKRLLSETRAKAQRLEVAQRKAALEAKTAEVELKRAEVELREAEQRFKKAKDASEYTTLNSQSISADASEATKAADDAKRSVERASKDLESLLREKF